MNAPDGNSHDLLWRGVADAAKRFRGGIPADAAQCHSLQQSLVGVEPEDACCYFSDLIQSCNRNSIQLIQSKAVRPKVDAGIEEATEAVAAVRRYDGAYIAALVPIADQARVCQVVCLCGPAVLLTDDVVHLAAKESVLLVDEAVLAQPLGPSDHQSAELSTDISSAQRRLTGCPRKGSAGHGLWRDASGAPAGGSGRARSALRL